MGKKEIRKKQIIIHFVLCHKKHLLLQAVSFICNFVLELFKKNTNKFNFFMMKITNIFALFLFFLSISAVAQETVEDVVSIGQAYANQVFYSLENGIVKTEPKNNWDICLEQNGRYGAIRINSVNGVELYMVPDATKADWETIDINAGDIELWDNIYNSDTSWVRGAFNVQHTSDPFDLGWGLYDFLTHDVIGDSIYILKLSDDSYRKLMIEDLSDEVWNLKYANLDGSNEIALAIDQTDYPYRNFIYYSFLNEEVLDREPNRGSWDLLFTQYESYVVQDTAQLHYFVSGVLSNLNTKVAEVHDVDVNTEDYSNANFATNMSEIGYDWKEYVPNELDYVVAENLVYFVQTQKGDIYKMVFTDFGGASNGNFEFTKQLLNSTSIFDATNEMLGKFDCYPNPTNNTNDSKVIYSIEKANIKQASLEIHDLSGKLLFHKNLKTKKVYIKQTCKI